MLIHDRAIALRWARRDKAGCQPERSSRAASSNFTRRPCSLRSGQIVHHDHHSGERVHARDGRIRTRGLPQTGQRNETGRAATSPFLAGNQVSWRLW